MSISALSSQPLTKYRWRDKNWERGDKVYDNKYNDQYKIDHNPVIIFHIILSPSYQKQKEIEFSVHVLGTLEGAM